VIVLILLRRRVFIGTVMGVASSLLALIYLTPVSVFLGCLYRAFFSPRAVEMTGMLLCTVIMENIMRKSGTMARIVEDVSKLFPDSRLVMAAMPATIGLLPSIGGAVFSAPLVEQASEGAELLPEQKALINYWYRHIWEYVSPLYPGVILVSGMTGLSFRSIALANLAFAVTVIAVGVPFCFRGIKAVRREKGSSGKAGAGLDFLIAISPIMLAISLVVIGGINPLVAMSGAVLALLVWHRYSAGKIIETFRESVSPKVLFLVTGVLMFRETLEATGALRGISGFLSASGIDVLPIAMFIPFLAGIMTGLTVGFVGITFPFLLPLLSSGGEVIPGLIAIAFGSGFCGVMLSPLHLCLVLSGQYFNADFGTVYRRLLVPSALVLAAGLIPYYLYS
jgi:integral membrane protein (TIGR00529 family)